jgi:ribonuclease HI
LKSLSKQRRAQARHLNKIIDKVLLEPTEKHLQEVLHSCRPAIAATLAERVRKRATLLARRKHPDRKAFLDRRDTLILVIYAGMAPADCYCAWTDGSVYTIAETSVTGLGGLLLDLERAVVSEFSLHGEGMSSFAAEIAAIETVLREAVAHGATRLRVHTDCEALVQLWLQQREDARLTGIRDLAGAFKLLQLHSVPRQHNHPAHRLAKQAALSGLRAKKGSDPNGTDLTPSN